MTNTPSKPDPRPQIGPAGRESNISYYQSQIDQAELKIKELKQCLEYWQAYQPAS